MIHIRAKLKRKDTTMKRFSTLLTLAALFLFAASTVNAQSAPVTHGPRFVDANGDGFNDNAPDADGDGIPNGQDPDYTGVKSGKGFVDANGDGVNDNAGSGQKGNRGSGSKGSKNGAGKGSKGSGKGIGTGVCTGTGQAKTR